MNDHRLQQDELHPHHNIGLVVIAIYSILKASLFLAIGIGAIHLLHQPVANGMLALARDLGVDPHSHSFTVLLRYAHHFNDDSLRAASAFFFSYAMINIVEGVGLYLEKVWAEYMTMIVTASFLPMEIIQLLHRQSMLRATLLVVNLLVLVFLGGVLYVRRYLYTRRQMRSANVAVYATQNDDCAMPSNA